MTPGDCGKGASRRARGFPRKFKGDKYRKFKGDKYIKKFKGDKYIIRNTYEATFPDSGDVSGYTTMFVQVLPSAASPIGNWAPDAGEKAPPRPVTTAPRAPAKLNVVLTGTNTVQVNWQNTSDNETGFVVERADNSSFTNPALINVGADQTSCTDTLPTTYKKYYYKVEAQNAAGNADSGVQNIQGLALKALNYTENGGYEAIRRDTTFSMRGAFGDTYDQDDNNTQWLAAVATDANPTPDLIYDAPVAYVCSANGATVPQVKVTFTVSPMPSGAHWMVKAEAGVGEEDVLDFSPAALKNGNAYGTTVVTATVTAASALPKYILNAELDIGWYVSFNGGKTWSGAGSTDNHLYLTGAKVGQGGAGSVTAYETTMAIGCIAASYLTPGVDDSLIVSDIFGAFSTLNVRHIVDGNPVSFPMTYWGKQWSGQNPLASNPEFFNAKGLLQHSDGRCKAWADFFDQTEMAQGEGRGLRLVFVTPDRPVADADMTFGRQQYNGIQGLVVSPAAPVQGSVVNPQNVFNNHEIVLWTEPPGSAQAYTLFDPSYGTATSGSGANFQTAVGIPWEHAALTAIRAYYGAGTGTSQDLPLLSPAQNDGRPNCNFL
jgi:hypothetical protein